MRCTALFLLCLFACDAQDYETPTDKVLARKGPAAAEPLITPEEAAARRAAETFLKALAERDARQIQSTALVGEAFQAFLPEDINLTGREAEIAEAAAKSEDPRLRRLATAKFYDLLPGDRAGVYLVIVQETRGTLQVLETGTSGGAVRVIRIGSDAGGDGNGRWTLDSCSAFAAPFKVPKDFGALASPKECTAQVKALMDGLSARRPEVMQRAASYLEGQPLLLHRREKVGALALGRFEAGQDDQAFSYGLEEGSLLQRQFVLGLDSYCNCFEEEE